MAVVSASEQGLALTGILLSGSGSLLPPPVSLPPLPTGGEWRLKYERAIREIDFTKKRMQQELEDKLEVEQQSKRQLERRVSVIPLACPCGHFQAAPWSSGQPVAAGQVVRSFFVFCC